MALSEYVDELSSLVHQLTDAYEPDGVFVLAQFSRDVQVIARSIIDAIDVAAIVKPLGAGALKTAAALVQQSDLDEVRERLLEILAEESGPPRRCWRSCPRTSTRWT